MHGSISGVFQLDKVIEILKEKGPLTGKELLEECKSDILSLWRYCNLSEDIAINIAGRRYLRFDRHVEGYARLSPSILREFLTYTVVGLKDDLTRIENTVNTLSKNIQEISNEKLRLAREVIYQIACSQKKQNEIKKKSVFMIAGDVIYNMAHKEPRPESSTGKMVKGSDLDIIIITNDLHKNIVRELDDSIYNYKYSLLRNPAYMEEIDYIIKDLKKAEEQLDFSSFEFMVASKILFECRFIYGSQVLFKSIKKLLQNYKIEEKLNQMEEEAVAEREQAKAYILDDSNGIHDIRKYINLFYTKEETEEIF